MAVACDCFVGLALVLVHVSTKSPVHLVTLVVFWPALQVWLVAGDCFLIGLAPVLVHMSKVDGKFPFHPVSINLLVEVAKTLFASAVLCLYVRPRAIHSVLEALP